MTADWMPDPPPGSRWMVDVDGSGAEVRLRRRSRWTGLPRTVGRMRVVFDSWRGADSWREQISAAAEEILADNARWHEALTIEDEVKGMRGR